MPQPYAHITPANRCKDTKRLKTARLSDEFRLRIAQISKHCVTSGRHAHPVSPELVGMLLWCGLMAFVPSAAVAAPGSAPAYEHEFRDTLQSMKDAQRDDQDYECEYGSCVADGERSMRVVYKHLFKKPEQVCVEVVSGKHAGSVLLYAGDRVRVHQNSGILSLIQFSGRRDHKWAVDLRGKGVHRSHWGYFVERHLARVELVQVREVLDENLDGYAATEFTMASEDPTQMESIAIERIQVFKHHHLWLKFELHDSSKLRLGLSSYRKIKLNQNLSDRLLLEAEWGQPPKPIMAERGEPSSGRR